MLQLRPIEKALMEELKEKPLTDAQILEKMSPTPSDEIKLILIELANRHLLIYYPDTNCHVCPHKVKYMWKVSHDGLQLLK